MNPVWSALVWKEWREHRWKLWALTAIVLAGPLMGLITDPVDRAGYIVLVIMLYAPIASAFVGMGAAAGERSRGTLPLLQSFPLDLKRAAAVKLAFAFLSVLAPILFGLLLCWAIVLVGGWLDWEVAAELQRGFSNGRSVRSLTGNTLLDAALGTAAFCVSIVCWVAALGVNRESEVRAGAIGLTVIAGLWALFMSVGSLIDKNWAEVFVDTWGKERAAAMVQGLVAAMPGGIATVTGINATTSWSTAGPAFLLAHGGLIAWYVTRFGKTANTTRWSPKPTAKGSVIAEWLDKPFASPLRALVWKQLRESGPVVATAFAGAVGVGSVMIAAAWSDGENHADFQGVDWRYQMFASVATYTLIVFGFLAGLIAGVGASAGELQPRLIGFWRSRPINIDLWFWSKWAANVLFLLAAFTLPAALLWGLVLFGTAGFELHEARDLNYQVWLINGAGLLTAPMLLGFTTALLAGCVLRHTVHAAVLSLVLSLGLLASLMTRVESDYEMAAGHGLTLLVAAAATIAAWLAVRHDWSFRK